MNVYLDNAATTPLDPRVMDRMLEVMREDFGNPSSIHAYGRKSRALIETSRKKIAELIHASPGEIFFTSGGTEADNMALYRSVIDLGIKHIISSPLEHHAVLHTLEDIEKQGLAQVHILPVNSLGDLDLTQLEELLQKHSKVLVSLMHTNNEIGNVIPWDEVHALCYQYGALFHSDMVQAIGHTILPNTKPHFIASSAHKYHGPKGIGFLYIDSSVSIQSFIKGGAQERGLRGGTENLYGIVGMAKALEIAYADLEQNQQKLNELKAYFMRNMQQLFPDMLYNGHPTYDSSPKIVNVCLPFSSKAEMMLFNIDIAGIAVSAGSACTSGINVGSHVLKAIGSDMNRPSFRFSFSKYNTMKEIDYVIDTLKKIYEK